MGRIADGMILTASLEKRTHHATPVRNVRSATNDVKASRGPFRICSGDTTRMANVSLGSDGRSSGGAGSGRSSIFSAMFVYCVNCSPHIQHALVKVQNNVSAPIDRAKLLHQRGGGQLARRKRARHAAVRHAAPAHPRALARVREPLHAGHDLGQRCRHRRCLDQRRRLVQHVVAPPPAMPPRHVHHRMLAPPVHRLHAAAPA
jgi:hypothetical protein